MADRAQQHVQLQGLILAGYDPDDPDLRGALRDAKAALDLVARLRALREEQGLSVEQVAESMEVAPNQVTFMERLGDDPHLSFLQAYARALGVRLVLEVHTPRSETGDPR